MPMLTPRSFDSSIPCSYRNDLLLNFPSMILRNFAGVTNRDFILGMLDNFRITYDSFLGLGRSRIVADYTNLYDQGRIALCEKYAEKNQVYSCFELNFSLHLGDHVMKKNRRN